jgi:FMN phosphatase YigB (HAD superfamily)
VFMTEPLKPEVGLLILDLDNTVWDWFGAWHASFEALLDELSRTSGVAIDQLKAEIKAVHQVRGTTEYSWLLDELPSLKDQLGGKKASEVFDSALKAQNSARKHNTRLYPGVLTTLQSLKARGVTLVAYTESLSFWTEWRMRLTGLDGIIDVLYSSPDHDMPEGVTPEAARTLDPDQYGMKVTKHEHVPHGVLKPNADILSTIIRRHNVAGRGVAYVGDSLDKDVEMAQSVGVHDVYAKYGVAFGRPEYKLLVELTHWKPETVAKERSTDPTVKAVPTYVLDKGFSQLLDLFDFGPAFDSESHVKLWQESVGVQMHFNDLGWRIRALALTALTFTFAAVGVTYANTDPIWLFGRETSPAAFVPILGLVLWFSFWFMDVHWFHRLLVGSVRDGSHLESLLRANGIQAGLGGYIGRESPMKFWWQKKLMHSTNKLQRFYLVIGIALALTSVGVFFLGSPHSAAPEPVPSDTYNFEIVLPSPSAVPLPVQSVAP